jgi:CheY-like chemotaxis protein
MSQDTILLVEDNANHARLIARALGGLALPTPVHVSSGEAAVLWIAANDCRVCLLDYDLPGINGLETLTRIRQRRPDLPVIMLSGARSEQVAIAAFRAGVVDFVPKEPGYHESVVHLVRQVLTSHDAGAAHAPVGIGPAAPQELLRPTYQNRLRAIGRQLDLYSYRAVNVLEVQGGFLVRGSIAGQRAPQALEFADRDFPQLLATAIAGRGEGERLRSRSPLLTTGYEDFLRALGCRLDQHLAEAITISELGDIVAVGGVAKVDGYGQTTIEPLQWLMQPDDIAFMLDEAYRRRATSGTPQKKPVMDRLLGRSAEREFMSS